MTLSNIKTEDQNSTEDLRRQTCGEEKLCSVETIKKRLPITTWLPEYTSAKLVLDMVAGITVGLTAIPQGLAYADVAGLSPEYGLYSGLMGGFVYLFLGSCKDITVGPTAIMSALISKYVAGYSADFAVLAAFMAGIFILSMGILRLGFLVNFISKPVISGFTTAAAFQIITSQLKSLLGLKGSSGHTFKDSMFNFVRNVKTIQLWDAVLGLSTIAILLFLKWIGDGCSRTDSRVRQLRWFISLSRNAVVIVLGMSIAYILQITTGEEPLVLIGKIDGGLPTVGPPPFSSVVNNETYTFVEMAQALGPKAIVIPFVAILESIAISKAFAGQNTVDASQEMIALGVANILGSLVRSMPITGSFSRSVLNHASGVQTPGSGVFTSLLVLLALSLLTSAFYFIPKALLGGLIISAMLTMIDLSMFMKLWKISKKEFVTWNVTVIVCLYLGLEYGILVGMLTEALMLLYVSSKPVVEISTIQSEKAELIIVQLPEHMSYCSAEHVRHEVKKVLHQCSLNSVIILDGSNVRSMDSTVASNLMAVVKILHSHCHRIVFLNFVTRLEKLCLEINPEFESKFLIASHVEDSLDVFLKT